MARSKKPKTHMMRKFESKARPSSGIGSDNLQGKTEHPLTMQQEARNSGRNIWQPESKLRHKPVGFVKGNQLQPENVDEQTQPKPDEPCELESLETRTEKPNNHRVDDDEGNDEEDKDEEDKDEEGKDEEDKDEEDRDEEDKHEKGRDEGSNDDEDEVSDDGDEQNENSSTGPAFFLDLSSQSVAPTRLPNPTSKLHSSTPEDSSGDEIVFHGRNKRADQKEYSQRHPRVEDEFMFSQPEPAVVHEEQNIPSADPGEGTNRDRRAATKGKKLSKASGDENEILADYIANIDVSYEETASQESMDLVEIRDSASSSSNDELQDIDLDTDLRIDDESIDEEADFENIESLRSFFPGQNTTPKNRTPISASRFADALESDPYYGFDIMDFDRPSLKKKPKGKKGIPDFMISDSELEMELESAWMNDREKKKNRKQKREELRSSGLLGRSSDKPDLRSKYVDGMSFDDMKSEIRAFLLSSKDSLPLPPMIKHMRKVAHDLANALSLKSSSRGAGSSRFTVLYKTSRTPKYNSKNISRVDKAIFQGKFRHRTIKTGDQISKKKPKSRSNPNAAVSYMDGDIVGASAPEIGIENKGRAMLEKMGWSSGTALGATNNKGILLPVAHVVKKSKAGLG